MPDIRIPATTEAAESKPFRVNGYDLPMGYTGTGTFETGDSIALHREETADVFADVAEDTSTVDSTNRRSSITSTGVYKYVKDITTGACGVSTD